MLPVLYQRRDSASLAVTVLVMAGLFSMAHLKPRVLAPPVLEKGMEIRMFEAPQVEVPAPPEAPRQVVRPERQVARPEQVRQAPTTSPQAIVATPSGALPYQAPAPASAPVATTAAPAVQPAPARPAPNGNELYVAKVKSYVLSRKRYPTGREASLVKPVGTVRAWVLLDRKGDVQEVGMERSGDSIILDSEALRLLRSGSYPAFPEDAFPGQSTHRFYFDLEYKRGGDS